MSGTASESPRGATTADSTRDKRICVSVDELREGDVLRLPSGSEHVIVALEGPYENGASVVVYVAHEEGVYENKARDHGGYGTRARVCAKSICPLAAGETVTLARRGAVGEFESSLKELVDAGHDYRQQRSLRPAVALVEGGR